MASIPIKSTTIRGPWFSLGFHIDFQRWYADLHIIWWIITIGRDYYESGIDVASQGDNGK